MRHRLANLFYRLGRAIDRPARGAYSDESFGDEVEHYGDTGRGSMGVNVHMRNETPVRGTFTPGSMTYAALTFGDQGATVTVFLTRCSVQRFRTVLDEFDRRYCVYGEKRP